MPYRSELHESELGRCSGICFMISWNCQKMSKKSIESAAGVVSFEEEKMTEIYHPKGSMCATCVHKDRDCSNLKFHSMHVLYRYQMDDDPLVFKVVLCGELVR